jgi:hypothetical protein
MTILEQLRLERRIEKLESDRSEALNENEELRAHNEVLRTALSSIMEYEPVREDFGPLPKHDKQFQAAQEIFKVALAALNGELSDNWRPIESAPRDGTSILVYEPPGENFPERYVVVFWRGSEDYKFRFPWSGGDNHYAELFNHWQPLPSPPREKEQEVE